MEWVSSIVLIMKKQGTIQVCVDYHDLNNACHKDNYPTLFIDEIIDNCVGSVIFLFVDEFSSYNQIDILQSNQHKTTFIYPWGTFTYHNLPFGLKIIRATFHRAMSYAFHDIKHILDPYLDDFTTHSLHHDNHIEHIRVMFLRCCYYMSHLNPQKCMFCIEYGNLLRFILSKDGIRVDPLKFEVITSVPPPTTIIQLQSFQGKVNFLHRFIRNYV
jgi:hypothetical protein